MYKIKTKNADFIVQEAMLLNFKHGNVGYYLLHKTGFRTDECVEKIALQLGISVTDIKYAGLKDEDAETTQYISISNIHVNKINVEENLQRKFVAYYIGSGEDELKIGHLSGNTFRIVIRNICADKEFIKNKRNFKVLNYYDVQRFGMPNCRKVTHLIGKELINGDYAKALDFLLISKNINDKVYNDFKENPKEYFDTIDPRRLNFFLSAYDAFVWNNQVMTLIRNSNIENCLFVKEEIEFLFMKQQKEINFIDDPLPIIRHELNANGKILERESNRALFVDTVIRTVDVSEDECNSGKSKVTVEFFLPPGSYATTVIDQYMNEKRYEDNSSIL